MPKGFVQFPPQQLNFISQWAYHMHRKAIIERRVLISPGVNRGQFNSGTGLRLKGGN